MTTLREGPVPDALAFCEREGLLEELRPAETLIAGHVPGPVRSTSN